MNRSRDPIPSKAGTRIPPEVLEALAHEPEGERRALVEIWNLAGPSLDQEPEEAAFRRLGVDVWQHLEAALRQGEAVPEETPERAAPASLRLVSAPLRLVKPRPLRWAAVAACLALLLSVGVLLSRQPVTYTAPYGQTAHLDLPDGSTVELNSGSTLRYARTFGEGARLVELEGEAFFVVTPSETPFSVETFNGITTVLGTRFNVRAWPDDVHPATDVTVVSGRVRLEARRHPAQALTLQAGASAHLAADERVPVASNQTSVDNALAWREGSFKFADQPLGTVTREIERRFDVHIKVTPESLLEKPVVILKENPEGSTLKVEEILRDICEYNGYEYRARPGGYEISQPDAE